MIDVDPVRIQTEIEVLAKPAGQIQPGSTRFLQSQALSTRTTSPHGGTMR